MDGQLNDANAAEHVAPARELSSNLFDAVTLPFGRVMPNRLAKAALYEHLAAFRGGPPNENHCAVYSKWQQGNWGMVITGNVQVTNDHLTLGRDLVSPTSLLPKDKSDESRAVANSDAWLRLTNAIHGPPGQQTGTLAIIQLSHAGRQSPNFLGGRPLFEPARAPSAVPLNLTPREAGEGGSIGKLLSNTLSIALHHLVWPTPREMSKSEVDETVEAFVRASRIAEWNGFDGVELHASHGYLISEFISPQTNLRKDEYGEPLRFLHAIVSAIRADHEQFPSNFVVGVKLNAADYVDLTASKDVKDSENMIEEERVLAHVRKIASWKMIDFIEISGGNYEHLDFMKAPSRRQTLFSRFSRRALEELNKDTGPDRPLVMLTGGFTVPELFDHALREKHAELIGVGRLAILHPDLPVMLRDAQASAEAGEKLTKALESEPLAQGIMPWKVVPETLTMLARFERLWSSCIQTYWSAVPSNLKPVFPKVVGAGVEMAWFGCELRNLATGSNTDPGDELTSSLRLWWYTAPGERTIARLITTFAGALAVVLLALLWDKLW